MRSILVLKQPFGVVVVLLLAAASVLAQPPAVAVPADVESLDAEVRQLVDRVYPSFVLIGGGSGVCISPDGYFLTNHHVWTQAAAPANTLVRMAGNSRRFTADAVGADPRGDIVLGKLRLNEGETVPYTNLADSDKVNVGDIALCIGNPFMLAGQGSEPTVTLGTVTSTYRFQGGYNAAIQIDTPINPGNSGGPAFNLEGEIIGINGRNISNHGQRFNTGAGYAIPSTQILHFMDAFKAQEGGALIVRHGMVGGLTFDAGFRGGARITEVAPNSEGEDAGLLSGDIIVKADHYEIFNVYRYFSITGLKPRHATFEFTVRRGDDEVVITARLDVPIEAGQFRGIPRSDEQARRDGEAAGRFRLPPMQSSLGFSGELNPDRSVGGYILSRVVDSGSVARAGLMADDILTHINGRHILDFVDIQDVLIALRPGSNVTLRYIRGEEVLEVEATTDRRPQSR